MIKRMIGRQYDQLLEICKQTKVEIEYLNSSLTDSDFIQRLEIEKTQELISSIEHDVQAKKQEIYNSEIKNRYQHLTDLYQQTRDEVRLLESTLETNIQKVDQSQHAISKWSNDDEAGQNPFANTAKRERLDLSATTESPSKDAHYEEVLKKWHDSLNKIDELEEEQQQLIELVELPVPEIPFTLMEPVPIQPEEEITPIEEVVVEAQEHVDPLPPPDVPEIETPKAPPVMEVKPEIPAIPPPPVIPEIPALPVEDEALELEERRKDEERVFPSRAPVLLANEESNFVGQPSKSKKAVGVVLNLLFYLILTISIMFAFLFGMYSPDGAPRVLFGYSIMRVATESMSPRLPVNTVIVTREVDPADLQVDDIVSFIRFNGTIITHRIYEIDENYENRGVRGFRLIGDANGGEPDNEVHQADNLIGLVVSSNYPFGRFLMFVYHYFLFIMIAMVSILIGLFLLKKKVSLETAKRKRLRRT